MQNILFIAYEFPPLNRIGTQRPVKFTKYLRDFNINPIVITLSNNSFSSVYGEYKEDHSLLKDLPADLKIYYIEDKKFEYKKLSKLSLFLQIFFNISGVEHKRWFKDYKNKIFNIIKIEKPLAIVVTAPPFCTIKTAIWTSRVFKIPLIIDMRDPWTLWRTSPYITFLHFVITKLTERYFFKKAVAVIATSKQTQNDFIKLHPRLDPLKFKYISNGYDIDISMFTQKIYPNFINEIIIGYVGSFYYDPAARVNMMNPWWKKQFHNMLQYTPRIEDWLYRSPYFFFKSISELFKLYPTYREKIKIKFAGYKPLWLEEMIIHFNLVENFQHLGHLTLEESFSFQKACDLLLITSSKILSGRDYSIAGKTFEYISFQKPILAFVSEGAQKDLLIESGVSIICNPDDVLDSVHRMKLFFENKITLQPNDRYIKTLHRKNLTCQLANIISHVIHVSE